MDTIKEQLNWLQRNYKDVQQVLDLTKLDNMIGLKRVHDNIKIIAESVECFDRVVSMPIEYGQHWVQIMQAIIVSTNTLLERMLDTELVSTGCGFNGL